MDFFETLKKIAEAAIVIAAFLFVDGWAYLYGYFTAFGLRTGDLTFPVQTVLMYNVPVLEKWWFVVFAFLIVIFALANVPASKVPAIERWLAKRTSATFIVLAIALALGVFLSRAGAAIGRGMARRDIVLSTSVLPSVQLSTVSSDVSDQACDVRSAWYKLLLHANGSYYVFKPLDVSSGSEPAKQVRVCIVPESQVRTVRIQVSVASQ